MNVTPDYLPRHLSREEWEALTPERREVEALAERLLTQDVLACQSALVDDLLKTSGDGAQHIGGFETDDIQNLYPDPAHWTAAQCRVWLDEHCQVPDAYPTDSNPWAMDREELLEALELEGHGDPDTERLRDELTEAIDPRDWERGIMLERHELKIREFNRLVKDWPHAGCTPDELRDYIKRALPA